MLSDGLKSKPYSLRNENEEPIYILKLKNDTMGEKKSFQVSFGSTFSEVYKFHATDGRIILKRTSENKLLIFKIYRVTKCPSLTVDILLLRQIMLRVSKVRLSFSVLQYKRKCT